MTPEQVLQWIQDNFTGEPDWKPLDVVGGMESKTYELRGATVSEYDICCCCADGVARRFHYVSISEPETDFHGAGYEIAGVCDAD